MAAIDDTLTIAPPLPPHLIDMRPDRFPRAKDGGSDIDGEHPIHARRVHVLHSCLPLDDADVVDQSGNRAERFIDSFEEPDDVLLDADICLNSDRNSGVTDDFLYDRVRRGAVVQILDAN